MTRTVSAPTLAWTLAVLLLAANVAAYVFDLYTAFWWFDRVLHCATIFAMTFWLAIIIVGEPLKEGRSLLFVVLIACMGISIGALWEVAEWALDHYFPKDIIKGKYDTLMDVVMDTIGALGAALLALHYRPGARRQGTVLPASLR